MLASVDTHTLVIVLQKTLIERELKPGVRSRAGPRRAGGITGATAARKLLFSPPQKANWHAKRHHDPERGSTQGLGKRFGTCPHTSVVTVHSYRSRFYTTK